jgi:hypothetical protein
MENMSMALENKGFFDVDDERLMELGMHVTRDHDGRVLEIKEGMRKWDNSQQRYVKVNERSYRLYRWRGDLEAQGNA